MIATLTHATTEALVWMATTGSTVNAQKVSRALIAESMSMNVHPTLVQRAPLVWKVLAPLTAFALLESLADAVNMVIQKKKFML